MILEYKGYVAQVDLDEDGDFHGRVINTRDVINFYGQTAAELQQEFERSVKTYLAICAEQGEDPERPFSGQFVVRVSPAVHRALAITAARNHLSLNKFVAQRLALGLEALQEEAPPSPPVKRRKAAGRRQGATAG
jgi:predicted HicB family RNase H-like nuclease